MANNICEYVEMINIQLLIRRILDMVNGRIDNPDCDASRDIANQMRQQVDPIVSIGVIGYALLAILMIIMILPNQVDRRSSSNLSNKRNVNNQNGRNNGFDDDDHNDNIT